MYGVLTTASFIQCSGADQTKMDDVKLTLSTNSALNDKLEPKTLYQLNGRLIPVNTESPPKLAYISSATLCLGPLPTLPPGLTNKTAITSLGWVLAREEV
ncbi:hypothetical protein PCASD_18385 [Puccinia coronata f. sp. avenae]|uniref:Uncharacterized protein n=1 Tax=Puccinia coronata f. sp. avenae TaxID=200324 RepID=A0A2N5T815_9BASI|nr:hypothetical protein PCASD_18385 [Puccinia coronata f. sp. avenae]